MTIVRRLFSGKTVVAVCALGSAVITASVSAGTENFVEFRAPAGNALTTRDASVDGLSAAILPNGRYITPAGIEVGVGAPKPFGMALSNDGSILATVNSGSSRFSVSLISDLQSAAPQLTRIDLNAAFLGLAFSADGRRFYAAGGENGNIWVGDTTAKKIIGSVNLNGKVHPLDRPLNVVNNPRQRFKGTFPGQMALSVDGKFLYVVDQATFQVFTVATAKIATGIDADGAVIEPDNFSAVVHATRVGRYPFGIGLSADGKRLLVTNVGIFQYSHLRPDNPSGDDAADYPLCYPGAGYPQETVEDRTIEIRKVDARSLDAQLVSADGIRCGYVYQDMRYTVPGLGDPNAPEASSVYVLDLAVPAAPRVVDIVKTGPLVGQVEEGIETFGGSHPNAVVGSAAAIYVANGNNDSVSVLHPRTHKELGRISLALLEGRNHKLKGVQPVALALAPDAKTLYVAEAGINAVGVIRLEGAGGELIGHIPTGWWPSSVQVSRDGRTLYVANARGRGAGPNSALPPDNLGSPKHSVLGSVSIIPVPGEKQLEQDSERVYANNGFIESDNAPVRDANNPIPAEPGVASRQIRHVIFINKENATHDLILGDITRTRNGAAVNGEPGYSLGYEASPNHHELALDFAFSDNFYLEPSVSSDGHRWLTNTYTTELEETHWPASYGGKRRDAGDDPEVIANYPGRIGFTDANSSPEPNDYNQHGSIYLHLQRHGVSFVNFGNGYEFAIIDEPGDAEPTGAREHVNVPMEKVVRDNSDQQFPTYNTHIPDAVLPEDPTRFSRFGRFRQVFEDRYVNRDKGECKLPSYVDLYYPNDHGGGAQDINPNGAAWSFKRYMQDNDAALGMTVDLISHSPCWRDTVIFVTEDDTQNGYDHVDGFRTIFLAISPWVKHGYVSKTHASLASIFKTVNLIFGLPAQNQYDAAASDLSDMFTGTPDFAPYDFASVQYAKEVSEIWIAMTRNLELSRPDADEVSLRDAISRSEGIPRTKATAIKQDL